MVEILIDGSAHDVEKHQNHLHEPLPASRNSSSSSTSELSTPGPKKEFTPSKRALSTTARLQRFVTSKMASTSAGQDLMTQALSEEAQMIIHWLIAAVQKCNSAPSSLNSCPPDLSLSLSLSRQILRKKRQTRSWSIS
jgi:hypothetical protein